jgi:hypothetical protein
LQQQRGKVWAAIVSLHARDALFCRSFFDGIFIEDEHEKHCGTASNIHGCKGEPLSDELIAMSRVKDSFLKLPDRIYFYSWTLSQLLFISTH